MKHAVHFLFCLICLAIPSLTSAKEESTEIGEWSLGINFGYGQRSAFILNQEDLNFYILPDFHYYGKNLFFDNGTLGYTFYERQNYAFSAITELNPYGFYFDQTAFGETFDRLYILKAENTNIQVPDRVSSSDEFIVDESFSDLSSELGPTTGDEYLVDKDALTKINKPGFSLDAGVQLNWFFQQQQVTVKLVTDVSSKHNGSRARINWVRSNKFGDFGLQWGVGFDWLDKATSSYYFAVNTSSSKTILTKRLSDTINPFISLTTSYPLATNLFLVAHLKYLKLDKEIRKSPIVNADHSVTQFLGLNYKF